MRVLQFYVEDANGRRFPIDNPPVVSVRRLGPSQSPSPLPSFAADALVEIESLHAGLRFAKVRFQVGPTLPIEKSVVCDITLDGSLNPSKMALPSGYSGTFSLGAAYVVEGPIAFNDSTDEAFVYVPNEGATISSSSSSVQARNAYGDFGSEIVDPTVTSIEKISLGTISGPLKIVHEEINITCAD